LLPDKGYFYVEQIDPISGDHSGIVTNYRHLKYMGHEVFVTNMKKYGLALFHNNGEVDALF